MKFNRIQLQAGLTILMAVLLFGLVGMADYTQERADAKFYCEQVEIGAWPDFRDNFLEVCNHGG